MRVQRHPHRSWEFWSAGFGSSRCVGLEAVILLHFDGEKVVVVFLGLPATVVLSEKRFGYLIEVVERRAVESKSNLRPRLLN